MPTWQSGGRISSNARHRPCWLCRTNSMVWRSSWNRRGLHWMNTGKNMRLSPQRGRKTRCWPGSTAGIKPSITLLRRKPRPGPTWTHCAKPSQGVRRWYPRRRPGPWQVLWIPQPETGSAGLCDPFRCAFVPSGGERAIRLFNPARSQAFTRQYAQAQKEQGRPRRRMGNAAPTEDRLVRMKQREIRGCPGLRQRL